VRMGGDVVALRGRESGMIENWASNVSRNAPRGHRERPAVDEARARTRRCRLPFGCIGHSGGEGPYVTIVGAAAAAEYAQPEVLV